MRTASRRTFLRGVGAGAVASAGLARPVAAETTPVVRMGNNYFDPDGLFVEPGTTVRFEIVAGAHSATAYEDRIPAGAAAFDSTVLSSGDFEYTFEEPGTYDYYCLPHESVGMVGRVVVGEPDGPAEESPIPSGDVPESETIVDRGGVTADATSGSGATTRGGMMGPGMMSGGRGGTMGGRGGGWTGWVPLVGGVLGTLGLLGLLYRALGRSDGPAGGSDATLETLRQRYARGEIDAETFEYRRQQLEDDREQ